MELSNLAETGDPGEEWFEQENGCVERISSWIVENLCAGDVQSKRILDVGCGNGGMLAQFARAGFRELTGTDYVEEALDLAKVCDLPTAGALQPHASIDESLRHR
jgi:2-polyprenyl-3-methyl-5-hydroxy-6-metoxy-1,4-benzoquinol methylase